MLVVAMQFDQSALHWLVVGQPTVTHHLAHSVVAAEKCYGAPVRLLHCAEPATFATGGDAKDHIAQNLRALSAVGG